MFVVRRSHHSVAKVSTFLQPPFPMIKKGDPLDKVSQLLTRYGFIQKSSPGMFTLLPLGQRVITKIQGIVDHELLRIGCSKITLPAMTPQKLWKQSGRLEGAGPELLTLKDRKEVPYVLCPTHEESVTSLVSQMHISVNQLPIRIYQMTSKFRDEARCRHGLLRSREFLMKDLYTFDKDEERAKETYDLVTSAYNNIFDLINVPYVRAQGSVGTVGGKFSHEYHYLSRAGQDVLVRCKGGCGAVVSADLLFDGGEVPEEEEQLKEVKCPECGGDVTTNTAIEVGHTFLLGDKYSRTLKCNYMGTKNTRLPYIMGCYGLGLSRILQASLEVTSSNTDNDDIKWPWQLAPYKLCIIGPKRGSKEDIASHWVEDLASCISSSLPPLADDVVIDDRVGQSIGMRVKAALNTGYPLIIVVGRGASEAVPKFEFIDNRTTDEGVPSDGLYLSHLELMSHLEHLLRRI